MDLSPVKWEGDHLSILDQRLLPHEYRRLKCVRVEEVVDAIKTLAVRGAPTLGVTGGYAVALSSLNHLAHDLESCVRLIEEESDLVRRSRPTARNLSWGVDRVLASARRGRNPAEVFRLALEEAKSIHEEEIALDLQLSRNGAAVLEGARGVLTHCNTGQLATAGQGSALGVIIETWKTNRELRVFATETRPLLQGARLTTFELLNAGVKPMLIVDSAAGFVMSRGLVDAVVVGADRILSDGTTANKVGTYTLAVLAEKHRVPFYVAAPFSTFDLEAKEIVVEQRSPDEVKRYRDLETAPPEVDALNPAFDITPPDLITGFITEKGVLSPPYKASITEAFGATHGFARAV